MKNIFKKRRKLISKNYLQNGEGFYLTSRPNFNINPYMINSNIYYLSGVMEKNTSLLIYKDKKGEYKEYLFVQKKDPKKEKWNGIRMGKINAKEKSGFEKVFYNEYKERIISSILNKIKTLFINYNKSDSFKKKLSKQNELISNLKYSFPHLIIKNNLDILKKMRMKKEDKEKDFIKKAIEITKDALYNTWKKMKPGMYEYEIKALLNYNIKKTKAKIAFNSIVASGENAVILHYPEGDRKVKDNDLVLFDVGARWKGYSADISRTVPVSGKFTDKQKKYYNIVLKTNKETIKYVEAGKTMKDVNNYSKKILFKQLKENELVSEKKELKKYYYHSIGHHLGLDTHDLSERMEQLKDRNVITIEPGVYIEEENIGIRVEDDIYITENDNINLSSSIVKEVNDIENIFNK